MLTYTKNDNRRRGILMMLLACLFFSLMGAVMKRLATDVAGRADGAQVAAAVKARLAGA